MSDLLSELRGECNWCNSCRECKAVMLQAASEIERLRGAMAADDERLRKASARVRISADCDSAEEMADEIECLRAERDNREYAAMWMWEQAGVRYESLADQLLQRWPWLEKGE